MLADEYSSPPLVAVELDVAELHVDAGRPAPARAYLGRAEARLEHLLGSRESYRFRRPWVVRARLQLLEGSPHAAAESAAEALRRYQTAPLPDRQVPELAQAHFVYAQALHALGRRDDAIAQAHAATAIRGGPLLDTVRTEVGVWLHEHGLPPPPDRDLLATGTTPPAR